MKVVLLSVASIGVLLAAWSVLFDKAHDVPRLPVNMPPRNSHRSLPPPGAVPFGEPESASSGDKLFAARCVACHGARADGVSYTASRPGMPAVGDLTHSAQSAEEQAEAIRMGQGTMPAFAGRLSEHEIENLVDFLQTIRRK